MTRRFTSNRFPALLGAILLMALAAPAPAQGLDKAPDNAPVRKDRVFIKDIEGIWINAEYVSALGALKSPHAAARKAAPVVIAIKREGRGYPIMVTNFDKASLQVVLDLEPDGKPGAYRLVVGTEDRPTSAAEARYIPFQGARNPQGKFDKLRFAEPFFMKGKPADFTLVPGELSPHLNRVVIAGRYRDEKGRDWTFSDAGEATWPEKKFNYELSLNDPGAGCDYFQVQDDAQVDKRKRYGFAWKGGRLVILSARMANRKVVCDVKPLGVLTPQ